MDDEAVAAFVARHGIRRLALFGSVLRDDFGPDSDIDVLVEFAPGHTPGLLGLSAMEIEFEGIVGRRVDMRTYEDLSRYFRNQVRDSARVLYAA